MNMRILAVVSVVLVTLGLAAAPVQARELTPGELEWVITPDDLQSPTGRILGTDTNQLGQTIPTGCSNVNTGRTASGRISLSTVLGEVDYRNGTSWMSTVWTYRSDGAAETSFNQLQRQSLRLCNDRFTGLIGDDVADMPAVLVDRAQVVPGATPPRFTVSRSQVLTDPANARPGYSNIHWYSVFTLAGDAVVEVHVYQVDRVTAAQRKDANRAATAITERYLQSQ